MTTILIILSKQVIKCDTIVALKRQRKSTMKKDKVLYAGIFALLIGLFAFFQFGTYQNIQQKVSSESEYYNQMFASNVYSSLHEIEVILDVLGSELIENSLYLNTNKSSSLMNEMLERRKTLAGFGLTDPEGNYISLSSNIDASRVRSLQNQDETRDTFITSRDSPNMVIGKAFFFKGLNTWILPLRKSLRDSTGAVIGIMTTGISLTNLGSFWNAKQLLPGQLSMIVNGQTRWRAFIHPFDSAQHTWAYQSPVDDKIFAHINSYISRKYNLDVHSIHTKDTAYTFTLYSNVTQSTNFITAHYNPRYKIWALTMLPTNAISNIFFERLRKNIFIFFGVNLIVLYLFFVIYRKEKQRKRDLRFQALHDPLTGLFNRTALDSISKKWTQRKDSTFSLLYIDLDNFKNINDAFGHSFGDAILKAVADRITTLSPPSSSILRHGGDEFSIFINTLDTTLVEDLSKKIISALSQPFILSNTSFHVGTSIGISQFPKDGSTIEELMASADLAMYKAKNKRNSHAFFNKEIQDLLHRKTHIEHHLRSAISNDELYMVYQPQLKADGSLYGVEALIRWENNELGFVPPDQFIPIAEESGIMTQLGAFIIDRSCSDFSNLCTTLSDSHELLKLSINISVRQFYEQDFTEQFLDTLEKYNLKTSQATLEITESLFIDEMDYILPLLHKIHTHGITISLDDFGTGYSSLSMIRRLPIDELKVDKSFVDNITTDSQDKNLVSSIIEMGHTLGMTVLAEGVEDKEQLTILDQSGCDLYQGYHFARPLKVPDLIDFIQK